MYVCTYREFDNARRAPTMQSLFPEQPPAPCNITVTFSPHLFKASLSPPLSVGATVNALSANRLPGAEFGDTFNSNQKGNRGDK